MTVIGCVQADVVVSPVTDLPAPGASALIDRASVRVGGAGANSALALVEAGLSVRLMGCVGDDPLGGLMREELAPWGLGGELAILAGEPTGLTLALESSRRDRTFLTYLGVNSHWTPEMLPADALRCESLLLCDYFVAPGMQGAAAHGLLDAARLGGARTFFDTAWDPDGFREAARASVLDLLPAVDVFLPNEAEACALAELDPDAAPWAARRLQRLSGGWVVVKLGARGALAVGPDGIELEVRAPEVHAVDTTGAGDAFNAGLIAALASGAAWQPALERAAAFASGVVARPSGARYRPPASASVG